MKIFEGMVLGIPIITGDLLDRRHILKNGEYCLLVKPGDVNDLKEALKKVLYN